MLRYITSRSKEPALFRIKSTAQHKRLYRVSAKLINKQYRTIQTGFITIGNRCRLLHLHKHIALVFPILFVSLIYGYDV